MPHILAHYILTAPAAEAATLAHQLMIEQTIEAPESLVADNPFIRENVVAKVDVEPVASGGGSGGGGGGQHHRVTVHYNADLACGQLPQLCNLLFGNISIKNNIRLVGVDLPDAFLANFENPQGLFTMIIC